MKERKTYDYLDDEFEGVKWRECNRTHEGGAQQGGQHAATILIQPRIQKSFDRYWPKVAGYIADVIVITILSC